MLRVKKRDKGFTLVEIIVVLLIIGILLAITIPSIMGYVRKVKEAQYIADARSVYLTAERLSYEMFATEFIEKKEEGMSKLPNEKITGIIKKIKSEHKNDDINIVDVIVYYDDIEESDYAGEGVYYSIKNSIKNHYISKIAVGFNKEEGNFYANDWVVIRVNEEARYFTIAEIFSETGKWQCNLR